MYIYPFFRKKKQRVKMIEDIRKAISILQAGGVILYPTDTIWGLGCDATNEAAVKRLFEIKKRIDTKAVLVLLDNPGKLEQYIDTVPDIAWELIECTDKPLTIIYPEAKNLASNLLGEDRSIGIRITTEAFSKTLCKEFKRPIVSTSANISGEKSPQHFGEISREIIDSVDFVVNYRQNETTTANPSSIIRVKKGNVIEIIRA